jgi:hypothetical protein
MGLLDFIRPRRKPSPSAVVGVDGVVHSGGFLRDGEKNADFTGRTRYRTTSNMMANCSIAGASVRLYLSLVGTVKWSAVPPKGRGAKAEEIAEIVEDSWAKLATPWNRVTRSLSMYSWHGFALAEWIAKRREDGVITFSDVRKRPQSTIERWDIDETGYVRGVGQRDPQTGAEHYLPREKLLYAVDDSMTASPEGLGLFRHVFSAVERRQKYEQLEGLGYEMSLRGIPIARAPLEELQESLKQGDITEAEFQQRIQALKNLLQNHPRGPQLGLLLDSATYRGEGENGAVSGVKKWDVELIRGDSASVEKEMAEALTRIDHEIARVANTEHLLLGQNRGTQALSTNKTEMLALVLNGIVNELVETVNGDYVEPMGRLNAWDPEDMPKAVASTISTKDVQQLTDVLEGLARSGAPTSPNDPAINTVRELAHLPPLDLDEIDIDAGLSRSTSVDIDLSDLEDDDETVSGDLPDDEDEE